VTTEARKPSTSDFMSFMGSLFVFFTCAIPVLLAPTTDANTLSHHPSKSSFDHQNHFDLLQSTLNLHLSTGPPCGRLH